MSARLTPPEWMDGLCYTDRPTTRQPGSIVVDGQPYVVATNGRAALLLAGDYECEPFAYASLNGMIAAQPGPDMAFRLDDLRGSLGPSASAEVESCKACNGTRLTECPECSGDGTVDCTCECGHQHDAGCDDCKGTGFVSCDCQAAGVRHADPFVIAGVPFDRRLVARYVRRLPDCDVLVSGVRDAEPCLWRGDGWLLLLMPLHSDQRKDAPEFLVRHLAEVAL